MLREGGLKTDKQYTCRLSESYIFLLPLNARLVYICLMILTIHLWKHVFASMIRLYCIAYNQVAWYAIGEPK